MAEKLYNEILQIQYGLKEDPFGWRIKILDGKKSWNRGIFLNSSYIQALVFVFHKTVEMVVDNLVDNLRKCVIVTILHQIA